MIVKSFSEIEKIIKLEKENELNIEEFKREERIKIAYHYFYIFSVVSSLFFFLNILLNYYFNLSNETFFILHFFSPILFIILFELKLKKRKNTYISWKRALKKEGGYFVQYFMAAFIPFFSVFISIVVKQQYGKKLNKKELKKILSTKNNKYRNDKIILIENIIKDRNALLFIDEHKSNYPYLIKEIESHIKNNYRFKEKSLIERYIEDSEIENILTD
tara:strand:- start:22611 stop:23264 length:654 start_codon:yes stop_codon:yes gene_type:complete